MANRKFRCGGARKNDIIDQSEATSEIPLRWQLKNRSLSPVDLSSLRTPTTEQSSKCRKHSEIIDLIGFKSDISQTY